MPSTIMRGDGEGLNIPVGMHGGLNNLHDIFVGSVSDAQISKGGGQAHYGSVGGSGGGNDNSVSAVVVSNCLSGIHGLAAADTNNDIGGQVLSHSGATQDLILGALAAKLLALNGALGAGVQLLKLFLHVCIEENVDQEEYLLAVDLGIALDVVQFVTTLDVTAGRTPGSSGMLLHGH